MLLRNKTEEFLKKKKAKCKKNTFSSSTSVLKFSNKWVLNLKPDKGI